MHLLVTKDLDLGVRVAVDQTSRWFEQQMIQTRQQTGLLQKYVESCFDIVRLTDPEALWELDFDKEYSVWVLKVYSTAKVLCRDMSGFVFESLRHTAAEEGLHIQFVTVLIKNNEDAALVKGA